MLYSFYVGSEIILSLHLLYYRQDHKLWNQIPYGGS